MALIGISQPDRPSAGSHQNTMQQIAEGVNAAANLLGLGLNAYKIFGVDKPEAEARAKYYQTESDTKLAPYYMQANPAEIAAGKGHLVPGGGDVQMIPKQEPVADMAASMRAANMANSQQNQWAQKAIAAMDQTRGNPALNSAFQTARMAQNAKSILAPYADDLNKAPPSQVALFNAEIAKIATNGVPSEATMKEIDDPTLAKEFSGFVSKVTNSIQGANQAGFLPTKLRYLDDLESNAVGFAQTSLDKKLSLYAPHLSDVDYKNIKASNDDFLQKLKSQPGLTKSLAPGASAGTADAVRQELLRRGLIK
jgi:hypothetical protein